MKFELKNAFEFAWEGIKGWAYNSKDDFCNMSAAYFEVTEAHGKVKTVKSDRTYFVIDGEGEFVIDGETIVVGKTDVVIVPKNTPYDYRSTKGTLKLFLIHSPAYDPEDDIKLD